MEYVVPRWTNIPEKEVGKPEVYYFPKFEEILSNPLIIYTGRFNGKIAESFLM